MSSAHRRGLPMLLEEHNAALAGCRRCGHGHVVRPIVSEARSPRIVIVGQAPGQVEEAGGRPFSGRAGKTLFRWLERAGVDEVTVRRSIYISAITRCYPGPSASGRGDRAPSPREQSLCADWLTTELRLIRPALLIPIGRMAIDRLLGKLPLDAVIGRAHPIELDGRRVRVVPLPHPSGASSWINLPEHKALLGRALELLRAEFIRIGVAKTDDGSPIVRRERAAARARSGPTILNPRLTGRL
ncbi:MAG: uracil-DNA glycosylase family protein [Gemmatimonadaceae bacterium]